MTRWFVPTAALLIAAGCISERVGETTVPAEAKGLWAVGVSPEQAAGLAGDAAKAVLVARAYLEQQAKNANAPQPQFLGFDPSPSHSGWDVRVQFVGVWRNGEPTPGPGYFAMLQIDRQWKVARVRGGA